MNHNLFDHVNIRKECTYVPDGLDKDSDAACKAYEEIIEKVGGIAVSYTHLDVYKRQP